MGSINYITTIINMRAPGHDVLPPAADHLGAVHRRHPAAARPAGAECRAGLCCCSIAWPAPASSCPAGGGEPLLWQHLFWFFGHPEVYILILPAMGIASDILSVFSRKPIFGYRAMAFSMIAIAFLSWIVWGHHMFQSGMNPTLGHSFMISTMVIAVPSAIKTFNWLGTLVGRRHSLHDADAERAGVRLDVRHRRPERHLHGLDAGRHLHPRHLLHRRAHPLRRLRRQRLRHLRGDLLLVPEDVRPHDERDPRQDSLLADVHLLQRHLLPDAHPRHWRAHAAHLQPDAVRLPARRCSRSTCSSPSCAIGLGLAQIPFVINFFYSLFAGPKAEQNPWQANTLEWVAPTPPPHGNFLEQPTVYRGPYEYSSPEVKEDWLPQNRKLGTAWRARTRREW